MTAYNDTPAAFEQATGRSFEREVHRLAKQYTARMASQLLGYSDQRKMNADLRRLGIVATFQPKSKAYTLGGHHLTLEQHAERIGAHPRTIYKRIERWGLCDRVVTAPLADVAMRAHNQRKQA